MSTKPPKVPLRLAIAGNVAWWVSEKVTRFMSWYKKDWPV